MIIRRNINGLEIEIETTQGNEIYLPENVTHLIKNDGIEGITDLIYNYSQVEHMPISVFIELTDYCNFSCPFCYINEAGMEHHKLPKFSKLKATLDFLISKGMLYCTISGGECLTHPDFKEIYLYLKKNGVLVSIFTNGYLINQDIMLIFNQYKPFKVEISLYGINDSTYRKAVLSPEISSKKIFNNILAMKESGIDVICKTPITSLTEDSFYSIKEWCNSNNIPFYSGYELQSTYSGINRDEFLASENIRSKMQEESEIEFYNDPQIIELSHSIPSQKRVFDCAGGKTEIFITSRYQIVPCMKAIGNKDWTFDIANLGIEQAYNRLTSKIFNIKNTPLQYCAGCMYHELCQECYFTQFDYENIAQHRKEYCQKLSNFCRKLTDQGT